MKREYDLKANLAALSKEQLVELLTMASKNLVAMDGVWFQVLEEQEGMDRAIEVDTEVWRRYPRAEAQRLKRFLGLDDAPGLKGLAQALALNYNVHANEASMYWEEDETSEGGEALVFRIDVCRVQAARARKGMDYHPCKPVGIEEYTTFARAIDDRIEVECLSCYPDVVDPTCGCAWRFTIAKKAAR